MTELNVGDEQQIPADLVLIAVGFTRSEMDFRRRREPGRVARHIDAYLTGGSSLPASLEAPNPPLEG